MSLAAHAHLLTFYGAALNEFGMPKDFHRYQIFVGPLVVTGGTVYVASIAAATDSPTPNPKEYSSKADTTDAFEQARRALVALHPGLTCVG